MSALRHHIQLKATRYGWSERPQVIKDRDCVGFIRRIGPGQGWRSLYVYFADDLIDEVVGTITGGTEVSLPITLNAIEAYLKEYGS
jgi:hypothetical protein